MRIEITNQEIEDKLIQDAAKMGMSPTQYICYMITMTEVKQIEKIQISPPVPELKKKIIKQKPGFVKNW